MKATAVQKSYTVNFWFTFKSFIDKNDRDESFASIKVSESSSKKEEIKIPDTEATPVISANQKMFLNNKEDHMSSFHSNTIMEVNHEGHIQVSDESEDSEPDFSFETAYQNITSKNKLIKNISKNASNSRDYEGRISYDFSSNKKYKISVTSRDNYDSGSLVPNMKSSSSKQSRYNDKVKIEYFNARVNMADMNPYINTPKSTKRISNKISTGAKAKKVQSGRKSKTGHIKAYLLSSDSKKSNKTPKNKSIK